MGSLVLHAGSLGDCVLAMQLAAGLRGGSAEVTLASRSSIAKWAATHGVLDPAVSLDHLLGAATGASGDGASGLVGRSFDRVVSFAGALDEEMGSRLRADCGDRLYSVDPRVRQETVDEGRHITRQWARDLIALGCEVDIARIGTVLLAKVQRDDLRRAFAERFGCQGRRSVIVHPGSGGLKKCLPIELLEGVVAALSRAGHIVAWMIGPDEMERFGADYTARLSKSAPVIYEDDVTHAADLVAGADVFIGYDAGMTHVAALAGVRTIAVFVATDPRVWCPLGARVTVFNLTGPSARSAPDIVDRLGRSALQPS